MISRSAATSPLADSAPEPASNGYSHIDARTTIDGTIATTDDLHVEGRVTGAIDCAGVLYIAEGAEVDATVAAGSIVVAGTLSGTARCAGRLEIRSTGVVRARVETERLIVLEGAVYEGQLKMETLRAAPEPVADVSPATEPEPEPEPQSPAPTAYSFLRSFTAPPAAVEPPADAPPDEPDDEP